MDQTEDQAGGHPADTDLDTDCVVTAPAVRGGVTAESVLADYVARADPVYAWQPVSRTAHAYGTMHVLRMTSQAWRSADEVDRAVWAHWLVVYEPQEVARDTAFLFITGGDKDLEPPAEPDLFLSKLAAATQSVTAQLFNVPNQPLVFAADEEQRPRVEDAILAFAWARYFETDDPEWLAHLPMTKSAVRAMDTVSAFCDASCNVAVREFVVTGASKRGWTTWLTAAVDPRVRGIAPMVIDMLNAEVSFRHHLQAYGGPCPAVHDYAENGIFGAMGTDKAQRSLAIVDPYAYRSQLTMPKLIINATGDQFFLPDSSQFYFHDLHGPKALRYVPNADHGLDTSVYDSLHGFYASVLAGREMPTFSWEVLGPGRLVVRTGLPPDSVRLWQATNPSARDFRVETIGEAWTKTGLEPARDTADGFVCTAKVGPPPAGWTAFLIEMRYPDPVRAGRRLVLTTDVVVVPDVLSHAGA